MSAATVITEPASSAARLDSRAAPRQPPTPSQRSMPLAGEHFAAALLYLLAGAVALVWVAPDLAAGDFLSPHVAGVTHLFTLGWLTTSIFGALYQLMPVALGAPIRWPRIGHASFWLFTPGVALFASGIARSSVALHHAGVGLVGAGILLVTLNIGATLPRARARDETWFAVAMGLTFLLSTLGLGLLLLHNLHTGAYAAARVRLLATHLHVALVGWALMMMVGVSHKLLPMFMISHGADTRWTRRALPLLAAGVPLLAAGLLMETRWLAWIGLAVLEGGVACFLRQAFLYHRGRVRKRVDVGMRFAIAALSFLGLAATLAPFVLALGLSATRLAIAYVVAFLLGGVMLYVVGFFYKIVPLLAWTARYRGRAAMGGVPTIAQMYSESVARVQLALMPNGVALLLAGIFTGSSWLARGGSALLLGGVLLFLTQIHRVAFGRPIQQSS